MTEIQGLNYLATTNFLTCVEIMQSSGLKFFLFLSAYMTETKILIDFQKLK